MIGITVQIIGITVQIVGISVQIVGIGVQIVGIGVQIVGIGVFFVKIDDLEQLFIFIGIRSNRPPWSFEAILCQIRSVRNYAAADMSIDNPKASATPNA